MLTFTRTLLSLLLLTTAAAASAMPARRAWRTVTLTDGTRTEATLVGDEHGHWLVDRQGRALASDGTTARYLTAAELTQRSERAAARRSQANTQRAKRLARAKAPTTRAATGALYTGEKRGIVILVNFTDRRFNVTRQQVDNAFNQEGYAEDHHAGSVHDFFYDQSYGLFDLEFDVVGPYDLPQPMAYYGGNDKDGDDKNPGEMVATAVKLADAEVDFSRYDWDGDGEVDQVFVMYAGFAESAGGSDDAIWPHEWELQYAGVPTPRLDGVKINTYAASNELAGIDDFTLEGIGTACHEFSHCLGYPDFYDTVGNVGLGMGKWDVLDYGSYNGYAEHGECPMAYTAYERWVAGWIEPTVLDEPCFVRNMRPLADDPTAAYIIYNDGNRNEYFLLENRQSGRWDQGATRGGMLGHGLLVTHVDYDEDAWYENTVNGDATHQRMTVVAADGTVSTDNVGCHGDPFPGSRNKHNLVDGSNAALTLFNNNADGTKLLQKPITDITESDNLVSFTFRGGPTAPQQFEPTDITTSQFTASWSTVPGADSYTLKAWPHTPKKNIGKALINEQFSGCTKTGTITIEKKLDQYTDTKGWSGQYVYERSGYIKMGKSGAAGYLCTPTLNSSTGAYTVYFEGMAYSGKENTVMLSFGKSYDITDILKQKSFTVSEQSFTPATYTCEANEPIKLMFRGEKRMYLRKVVIYGGEVSQEDIQSGMAADARLFTMTRADGDTIVIEGLTEPTATVAGLTLPAYEYCARAVVGGVAQPWGKSRVVTLSATAIADIHASTSTDTRIFTLSGQYVGTDPTKLGNGIYVIGGKKRVVRKR